MSPTSSQALPRLLVFARAPQPGRVKTRLIPALGVNGAAALYRRLLARTLDTAVRVPGVVRELWCDGDGDACRELARHYGMLLRLQSGDDLGERMHRALAAGDGAPAVLIGSDCPGYNPEYLGRAFAALSTHDLVLGPALDGGYVLIGARRSDPRLFQGIAWGGEQVLADTRKRLRELGLDWCELPVQRDLDRPEDLAFCPEL